jgi:hypothetical protein
MAQGTSFYLQAVQDLTVNIIFILISIINIQSVQTKINKNFWEELIAYFPFTIYCVFDTIRTAYKTQRQIIACVITAVG